MQNKIISIIIVLSLSISAFAQQMVDVVYLKNGSIIKGTIIEQILGGTIKIKTADGSLFVYDSTDVERIEKEKVTDNIIPHDGKMTWSGKGLIINGTILNEETSIELLGHEQYELFENSLNNYRIASLLFVGGGVGVGTFGILEASLGAIFKSKSNVTAGLILAGAGAALLIPGIIIRSSYKSKMDSVVNDYNNNCGFSLLDMGPIVNMEKNQYALLPPDYIPLFSYSIVF